MNIINDKLNESINETFVFIDSLYDEKNLDEDSKLKVDLFIGLIKNYKRILILNCNLPDVIVSSNRLICNLADSVLDYDALNEAEKKIINDIHTIKNI